MTTHQSENKDCSRRQNWKEAIRDMSKVQLGATGNATTRPMVSLKSQYERNERTVQLRRSVENKRNN
jgi:hypothetical protein